MLVDSSKAMSSNAEQAAGTPRSCESLLMHSPWLRRAVSVALAMHLMALVIAPLAVAPTSPMWQRTWRVFQPYLESLFLNHGYHYFAPEPGPSHLVHYELRFNDGRIETGVFPNAMQHQPRLRYHRHFMLSEFLNSLAIDGNQAELFESVTNSYAEHLRHTHHAAEVTLNLRRHYVPSPQHVSSGRPLNDLSLFAERPLGIHGVERR